MRRASGLFVLALVSATVSAGQASTLVSTDFSKGGSKGWCLNGDARLGRAAEAKLAGPGSKRPDHVLELTSSGQAQTGVAWTVMKCRVSAFSYVADVRIRFDPRGPGDLPADGFTMAFAPVDTGTIGGGGGSLGLFGGAIERFTAFEINTWRGQGLDPPDAPAASIGKNETFAFDVITPRVENPDRAQGFPPADPKKGGAKIGQIVPPKGMKIVNGGWYRYQWDAADDGTMRVYVTGLDGANRRFQKVKVLETRIGFNPIGFEGRFGLTAASGGAVQRAEVARVRIEGATVTREASAGGSERPRPRPLAQAIASSLRSPR